MTSADVVILWDGRAAVGRPAGDGAVFAWHRVPAGLATYRQLRRAGLRPAGQPVTYRLEWRGGHRWARLYRLDLAAPVRPLTPGRTAALRAAQAALRTCRSCGTDAGFRLPRVRLCWSCFERSGRVLRDPCGMAA